MGVLFFILLIIGCCCVAVMLLGKTVIVLAEVAFELAKFAVPTAALLYVLWYFMKYIAVGVL